MDYRGTIFYNLMSDDFDVFNFDYFNYNLLNLFYFVSNDFNLFRIILILILGNCNYFMQL